MPTEVSVETGAKRAFVWAPEWPGWCRSGRTEADAIERLVEYRDRYATVVSPAGLIVPVVSLPDLMLAERLAGRAGTDFGVPSSISDADRRAGDADDVARQVTIVAAAWQRLDADVAAAPSALRKGPRGGGRDRDKMFAHTVEADEAYAREMGVKRSRVAATDHSAIDALRAAMLDALRRPSDGPPMADRTWPPRYAARRIAWHALDHAWEIEDRSET